ncbi:glucokinase [Elasticomyces elasticus]|nr:glucokinase [Elasticomyces elasticus]
MALKAEAQRMAAEFEFSRESLNNAVRKFAEEMTEGLEKQGTHMSQIPTYVTAVPNGTETSKVAVPRALMETQVPSDLFGYLAKQIEHFLETYHADRLLAHRRSVGSVPHFDLGFTFSFPVDQTQIDALRLPVRVTALVNDTVGTLMARSYTSPGNESTLLGAIFGTGTNGAYVEQLDKVKKMKMIDEREGGSRYDRSTGLMIVNTEWGSFDNALNVLPDTPYDQSLDNESNNKGIQMFEKRVSGMFLGEILRRAILALYNHPDPEISFLKDVNSGDNDMRTATSIDEDSALFKQWGIDTSFLSIVEEDQSDHLRITKQMLEKELGISGASTENAIVVKMLVHAIGRRAARLAAVAMGAVVLETRSLEKDGFADIGVDGSLVEYYPGFEDYVREAFREMDGIGAEGEKKIRIGLAKDGSGLGAALIALVAHESERRGSI